MEFQRILGRFSSGNAQATPGNDVILGTERGDRLTPGTGDDLVDTVGGPDVIVYARGDGDDIVRAQSFGDMPSLELTDILPGEVEILRQGDDLVVSIPESAPGAGNGGSLRILDGYPADTDDEMRLLRHPLRQRYGMGPAGHRRGLCGGAARRRFERGAQRRAAADLRDGAGRRSLRDGRHRRSLHLPQRRRPRPDRRDRRLRLLRLSARRRTTCWSFPISCPRT